MAQFRLFIILLLLTMHKVLWAHPPCDFQSAAISVPTDFTGKTTPFLDSHEGQMEISHKNMIQDTLQLHGRMEYVRARSNSSNQWVKAAIVPATLTLAGTITLLPDRRCVFSKYHIQDKVLDLFSGYHTSMDNYLQYAPLGAVFVLKASGLKSRSNFINQVALTAKSEFLMALIVEGMKRTISSQRPSNEPNSMPSGHAAKAFVSAAILDMEYRDISPWISVGGYAVATTTAILRMANNEHWISDVLIGAGIGIFSTKVIYLTHQYRWGGKNKIVVVPTLYRKGAGLAIAMEL